MTQAAHSRHQLVKMRGINALFSPMFVCIGTVTNVGRAENERSESLVHPGEREERAAGTVPDHRGAVSELRKRAGNVTSGGPVRFGAKSFLAIFLQVLFCI